MASALTTQFAQGPKVVETLASVLARIEPIPGVTKEQLSQAADRVGQEQLPDMSDITDPFSRKYARLRWALNRRNAILEEIRKHG